MTGESLRSLNFPANRSLGHLYTREPRALVDEMWMVSMPSKTIKLGEFPQERFSAWTLVGPAMGVQEVALGRETGLRISTDFHLDLRALEVLEGDDLQALDLSYTPLKDAGFPDRLRVSGGLKYLDLSFTLITSPAALSFGQFPRLEVLHLAFTKVGRGIVEGTEALGAIRVLNLMGTGLVESHDTSLSFLTRFPMIECLDLSFNRIGDDDLTVLEGLVGLRTLNLANTDVSDGGLEVLARLKGLRRLYLGRNRITDAGVRHLAGMKGLRTLSLSGPGIGDRSVEELSVLGNLEKLFIRGTRISATGMGELKRTLAGCDIDDRPGDERKSSGYDGTRVSDRSPRGPEGS